MYCQSILTDKVHQPLATVRVVPLYQMCGRVAYLCVAFFAPYCKGLWEVCEFWMDFSVRTLPKWQSSSIHQSSGGLVCTLQYTRLCIAVLHLAQKLRMKVYQLELFQNHVVENTVNFQYQKSETLSYWEQVKELITLLQKLYIGNKIKDLLAHKRSRYPSSIACWNIVHSLLSTDVFCSIHWRGSWQMCT